MNVIFHIICNRGFNPHFFHKICTFSKLEKILDVDISDHTSEVCELIFKLTNFFKPIFVWKIPNIYLDLCHKKYQDLCPHVFHKAADMFQFLNNHCRINFFAQSLRQIELKVWMVFGVNRYRTLQNSIISSAQFAWFTAKSTKCHHISKVFRLNLPTREKTCIQVFAYGRSEILQYFK